MENISWKIIDRLFNDNPNFLVSHHLDSYNDFINVGIRKIFQENNPIRFTEKEKEKANECLLYFGGKDGSKIYFGKPIIYDEENVHFMFPNEARLRNMTYGITIHYDIDVDFIINDTDDGNPIQQSIVIEKVLLGKFPIMLKSNVCVLNKMTKDVCYQMGECRNDHGGYFIIDGKEKAVVCQEKFADNMINVKLHSKGDLYSHSAEIRSVSEDTSKPIRTCGVRIIDSHKQIVVSIPNVKKHIPLFILMRAFGITSDKKIIEMCLLDLEKQKHYIELFRPSIHDANIIFNQQTALEYIASFTKRGTLMSVMDILSDYFLPHIGDINFLEKAFFVGHMVFELLKVYTKEELPTDRDSFKFKRIELSGVMFYELFREYYLIQKNEIYQKISKEYYYHRVQYQKKEQGKDLEPDLEPNSAQTFMSLIELNYGRYFKDKTVEKGIRRAFKGNWGAHPHTKKIGAAQELNRLSYNSALSQLRKLNLPLDSTAKVVGPRLLNSTQWGFIDPIDTPDGGNIGLHKHLAIGAQVTCNSSGLSMEKWIRKNVAMKLTTECTPTYISKCSKIFVNGKWIGIIEEPLIFVNKIKLFRRNGIIPIYTSISFDYRRKIVNIFTDSGRLTRPIYYIENNKISYERKAIIEKLNDGTAKWEHIVSGFKTKSDESYNFKNNLLYDLDNLYNDLNTTDLSSLQEMKSIVDFVDTSEEENAFIALKLDDLTASKYYTHLEIEPSLLLGVMGNQVIFPENNPATRDAFFCGQAKQAVSVFHTNYQMRIDKMSVVLNYGQIPLIKSRYLQYINNEEHPYGVNTIVAIMSYTGYNVEDAILINKGSIDRGLFRTTYYSMYEAKEESSKISGGSHSKFANIQKNNVSRLKQGYDYSMLDDSGLVKENTPITDKTIVIGKINANLEKDGEWIDDSVKTKKGQLGFVDKSFITDGEEGFNIAKVRIREERIPAIGDKMGSRAGQKGTVGLIIPECDMPFTEDGIKPDLIINPHAIPSRMTIGQIIETMFGKLCSELGTFGDCTAYQSKGSNISTYGEQLTNAGFHSSGNQLLHDAQTGEQLTANIFIGPTYYMRLKHMVKDKINYRARGPITVMTRQSVHGRANDGGLRIGEMERDGILGHGMSAFLNDSFLNRGDEYYIAVCNNTGSLAIYNESRNLFLSPQADGPVQFVNNVDGTYNIKNVSKFGRSFSILRVPYSFKLLLQELQAMNVHMRLITDDNVDKLLSMSYSDNINKIVNASTLKESEDKYISYIAENNARKSKNQFYIDNWENKIENNEPIIEEGNESETNSTDVPYAPYSTGDENISIPNKLETIPEPQTPSGSPPDLEDDEDEDEDDSFVELNLTELDKTNANANINQNQNLVEKQPEKEDNTFLGFDLTNIFGTDKKQNILDVESDSKLEPNSEPNSESNSEPNSEPKSEIKKVTIKEDPEIK